VPMIIVGASLLHSLAVDVLGCGRANREWLGGSAISSQ
jgi:hypothetical protein